MTATPHLHVGARRAHHENGSRRARAWTIERVVEQDTFTYLPAVKESHPCGDHGVSSCRPTLLIVTRFAKPPSLAGGHYICANNDTSSSRMRALSGGPHKVVIESWDGKKKQKWASVGRTGASRDLPRRSPRRGLHAVHDNLDLHLAHPRLLRRLWRRCYHVAPYVYAIASGRAPRRLRCMDRGVRCVPEQQSALLELDRFPRGRALARPFRRTRLDVVVVASTLWALARRRRGLWQGEGDVEHVVDGRRDVLALAMVLPLRA